MQLADDAVLRAITRDVLDPEVLGEALDRAFEESQETDARAAARVDALRTELAQIETELVRYAEAIADAGALGTILDAIRVREHRREAIRAELKLHAAQRRVEHPEASELRSTFLEVGRERDTVRRPIHGVTRGG